MANYLKHEEIVFPKRRKAKDNPYQITYCAKAKTYAVTFRDGAGQLQTLAIDQQLYQVFNQFELEDLSQLNEYDRHIEQSELTEYALHKRAAQPHQEVAEQVETKMGNERLQSAIQKLPPLQRSRLMRYYFDGLTYEEIARQDGCSFQTVARTIQTAERNLQKFFPKGSEK